jgi:hypothetical protein
MAEHDDFALDPHLQSHPLLWRLQDALRGVDDAAVCFCSLLDCLAAMHDHSNLRALCPVHSHKAFQPCHSSPRSRIPLCLMQGIADDGAQIPSHHEPMSTREQQKAVARHFMAQRRHVPPAINVRNLFTRAAPYGNPVDPMFHSTCNRIGSNYSPEAALVSSALFEEYPADPKAIRRPSPQAFQMLRSEEVSADLHVLRAARLTQ